MKAKLEWFLGGTHAADREQGFPLTFPFSTRTFSSFFSVSCCRCLGGPGCHPPACVLCPCLDWRTVSDSGGSAEERLPIPGLPGSKAVEEGLSPGRREWPARLCPHWPSKWLESLLCLPFVSAFTIARTVGTASKLRVLSGWDNPGERGRRTEGRKQCPFWFVQKGGESAP